MTTVSLEMPTVAPGKPRLMSHSRWSGYLRCPNQLRLRKGGYPVVPAWALIAGSAFHAACDVVDYMFVAGDSPADDDCDSAWLTEFSRQIVRAEKAEPDAALWRASGRRTKDKPNKEDGVWWETAGAGFVRAYRDYRIGEREIGFDIWTLPDGSPAIELPVEFEILPGVLVRGSIDRVMIHNGVTLIRDLKTSQREPSDSAQLGIYKVALEKLFGVTAWWGDYFLARTGAPSPNPVDLTHYTAELFADEYGAVAKMMALGLYPANPGDACGYCDVKAACAVKGGVEADAWRLVMP